MSDYQVVKIQDVEDWLVIGTRHMFVSTRIDDPSGDGPTLEYVWPL
jgi:hypothetical protein